MFPKSFRFTTEDNDRINQLKAKLGLNKDIDVIRYLINNALQFRNNVSQCTTNALKKQYPYTTYRFLPNPHGEFKPYFSDFHESEVIIIQNKKHPFDNVILKKGDEWFDYVLNQQDGK
jgi:hypothetical protein